ncbi:unnamed protein product [[Candida] boidinii]|uniref:Unnamed protein product n=1 Tax=Candida boidinii TaxID=5477 RepID=A0A9W6SXZ0_CANBO|nr:hypothetical protein B5S30_g64 [[Candida] boidinii]OWB82050.1 hypothetical protein B5S33_g671 [[Candida] boidinii]GME69462.1 unnamed protein product [[Candida] boidinii]GMG00989.1 unnamed protein product [[Candida] boidinii]
MSLVRGINYYRINKPITSSSKFIYSLVLRCPQNLNNNCVSVRYATTVSNNDYDIDLITLKRKGGNISESTSNSSFGDSNSNNAESAAFTALLKPSGYDYFEEKFKKELQLLKDHLLRVNKNVMDPDFDTNTIDVEGILNRFKIVAQYGKSFRQSKEKLATVLLFITTMKRNPKYLQFFIEDDLRKDIVIPKKKAVALDKENFHITKDDGDDDVISVINNVGKAFHASNTKASHDDGSVADKPTASNNLGSFLKQTHSLKSKAAVASSNKGDIETVTTDTDSVSFNNSKSSVKHSDSLKGFDDLLSSITKGEINSTKDSTIATAQTEHKSFYPSSASASASASESALTSSASSSSPLTPETIKSEIEIKKQKSIDHVTNSKADTNWNINELEHFLSDAKTYADNEKESIFKAQRAYEWSRAQSSPNPRLLENRNFFTPICYPTTLIPINKGKIDDTVSKYKIPQYDFLFPKSLPFEKEYLILSEDGQTVKSRDSPFNSSFIPNDMFTIFGELKNPENYISKVNKLQNKGWKLISCSGNESKLLIFERPYYIRRQIVYNYLKSGFAVVGLVFACIFALSMLIETDEIMALEEARRAVKAKRASTEESLN